MHSVKYFKGHFTLKLFFIISISCFIYRNSKFTKVKFANIWQSLTVKFFRRSVITRRERIRNTDQTERQGSKLCWYLVFPHLKEVKAICGAAVFLLILFPSGPALNSNYCNKRRWSTAMPLSVVPAKCPLYVSVHVSDCLIILTISWYVWLFWSATWLRDVSRYHPDPSNVRRERGLSGLEMTIVTSLPPAGALQSSHQRFFFRACNTYWNWI